MFARGEVGSPRQGGMGGQDVGSRDLSLSFFYVGCGGSLLEDDGLE